eukprot:Opistho-2@74635
MADWGSVRARQWPASTILSVGCVLMLVFQAAVTQANFEMDVGRAPTVGMEDMHQAHSRGRRALSNIDPWWCSWFGGCDPFDGVALSLISTAANCTDAPGAYTFAPTCGSATRVTCQSSFRSYIPYSKVSHNISKTTTLKSCGLFTGSTAEPTTLALQAYIVVGTGGPATLSTCTGSSTRQGDTTLIGVMTGTCGALTCLAGVTSSACGAHRTVTFTTTANQEYVVYVTGAGGFTLTASGAIRLGTPVITPTVRRGQAVAFAVSASRDLASAGSFDAMLTEPGALGESSLSTLGFTATTMTSSSLHITVPVTAKVGTYTVRYGVGALSTRATFTVLPAQTVTFNERRKDNMDAHRTQRFRAACTATTPTGTPTNTACAAAIDLGASACNTFLIDTTAQKTATMTPGTNAYCAWLDSNMKAPAFVQWFKFVSPGGNISISTCSEDSAEIDTFVAAWIGTCPTSTTKKQCDLIRDDTAGCNGYNSKFEMKTVAGTTYYFVIGAHGGAKGQIRVTLTGDAAAFNRYTQSVYRRGQEITLDVNLATPLDPMETVVPSLDMAEPVAIPQPITSLSAPRVSPPVDWFAYYTKQVNATKVQLSVYPPANAYLGDYTLSVDVGGQRVATVPFTLIFNPMVQEDDVYYENAALREEYVFNENGLIWRGSAGVDAKGVAENSGYGWGFDQFNLIHLTVAINGLKDLIKTRLEERRAPFRIARQLSYYIGNEVLEGRWSGDYADGKDPSYWHASNLLLESYWTTKLPTKYAQCWVFSGVSTTIARALGIPVRSVTNFESAHEDARTTTPRYTAKLSMYYALSGDSYLSWDTYNDGSIWNFHVWNDMWFRRPDIGQNRPDWNAVDATPQEVSMQDMKYSEAQYQMGPAYLPTVKARNSTMYYDTDFVISEVDADYYEWLCSSKTKSTCKSTVDIKKVGQETATKLPGFMVEEDPQRSRQLVVNDYKNETINNKARARRSDLTMRNAVSMDAWVEYVSPVDPVVVVELHPEANADQAPHRLVVRVDVEVTSYTGDTLRNNIHAATETITPPREVDASPVTVRLPVDKHHSFVGRNRFLRLIVSATCPDTGDVLFFTTLTANPRMKLDVSIQYDWAVSARNAREAMSGHFLLSGTEARPRVRFTNPLPHAINDAVVQLTSGTGSVIGMGGLSYSAKVHMGRVEAGASVTALGPRFIAIEEGQHVIHASMEGAGLADIHGHTLVYVAHR